MKHFGLQAKAIIAVGLLMLLTTSVVVAVVARSYGSTLRSKLTDDVQTFANLATEPIGETYLLYKDSGRVRIQQQLTEFVELNPALTNIAVISPSGEIMFALHDEPANEELRQHAATFEVVSYTDESTNSLVFVAPYFEDFGLRQIAVVYTASEAEINRSINQIFLAVTAIGLSVFLAVSTLTYLIIDRFFLRRIKHIQTAAINISNGKYDEIVNVSGNDELSELAGAVSKMADTLQADIKELKEVDDLKTEFMIIAAHNLRSPVTVIKGALEGLQEIELPQEAQDNLKFLRNGTENLGEFVGDILTTAEIETSDQLIKLQKGDLIPMLSSLSEQYSRQAQQKNITFNTVLPSSMTDVAFHDKYLSTALGNVLNNAIKFSAANGVVNFRLENHENEVAIIVSDNGKGIAKEELDKLFTKFHRGVDIMRYDYEGIGLGLYMTKLIVDHHHGTIDIQSTESLGTTVTINLPKTSQPSRDTTGEL